MRGATLLLINPGSRKGEETARDLIERFKAMNLDFVPFVDKPGGFSELIRAHRHHVSRVVIAGGDGSVNAAVPGLLKAGLPFGVIPLGTANNLARNLGIPFGMPEACDSLSSARSQKIDLGWVNGVPFLNVAGIGLSTRINRTIPAELKRRWGAFGYGFHAFQKARTYHPFWVEIRSGGQSLCIRSHQLTICNGRHYGSGMTIQEDASLTDGQLDLSSVEARGFWQALRILPALKRGTPDERPEVFTLRGARIEILTRRPMRIDTDGEITTHTPAVFHVQPGALEVLAPAGSESIAV